MRLFRQSRHKKKGRLAYVPILSSIEERKTFHCLLSRLEKAIPSCRIQNECYLTEKNYREFRAIPLIYSEGSCVIIFSNYLFLFNLLDDSFFQILFANFISFDI